MSAARFVATLVAPKGAMLSQDQITQCRQQIEQCGAVIDNVKNIDSRAADIFFIGDVPLHLPILSGIDVIIQPVANRRKKILIADMESTIIEQEMLDELAAEIGMGQKVADITRRAMNGELDFAASLTERVGLLRGQPESLLHKVAQKMTFTPGACELVAAMKKAGAQCWLVSGGFTYFVKVIAEQAGFNRFFANDLLLEAGVITGKVGLPMLDKQSKYNLLERAFAEYGCTLANCLAVGDGANDVPMLQACQNGGGLGVAYRAKPKVREIIHAQINQGDLSTLIYAQGL